MSPKDIDYLYKCQTKNLVRALVFVSYYSGKDMAAYVRKLEDEDRERKSASAVRPENIVEGGK